MTEGNFYFINNQYFIDFPDPQLMKNKETINGQVHNRPCYYLFKDNLKGLYWMIPISSKVNKYEQIYNSKISKYGKCDTLEFGYILGEKKAFLLQNMCPVINEYIENTYINLSTGLNVSINSKLDECLKSKGQKILKLKRKGFDLIFPNVISIETSLLKMLEEKKQNIPAFI